MTVKLTLQRVALVIFTRAVSLERVHLVRLVKILELGERRTNERSAFKRDYTHTTCSVFST